MDYASLISGMTSKGGGSTGGAGGGGGYGGDIKTDLKSGGESRAAFGAVNFGAGASVGGTSTAESTGVSGDNKILLYVGIGVIALVAIFILLRR